MIHKHIQFKGNEIVYKPIIFYVIV